jgi:hypothetical protein
LTFKQPKSSDARFQANESLTHFSRALGPGVDANDKIRSLPLPNLSEVTRESAKEYFDNSWTLFETLFAGLRGEEGFFR